MSSTLHLAFDTIVSHCKILFACIHKLVMQSHTYVQYDHVTLFSFECWDRQHHVDDIIGWRTRNALIWIFSRLSTSRNASFALHATLFKNTHDTFSNDFIAVPIRRFSLGGLPPKYTLLLIRASSNHLFFPSRFYFHFDNFEIKQHSQA
jgi:hypothetical protein